MKRYLLNISFIVDSYDVDNGLFLLEFNNAISKKEIEEVFKVVNSLLQDFEDCGNSCEGINIDTLIRGVKAYTCVNIIRIHDGFSNLGNVDKYFEITVKY